MSLIYVLHHCIWKLNVSSVLCLAGTVLWPRIDKVKRRLLFVVELQESIALVWLSLGTGGRQGFL